MYDELDRRVIRALRDEANSFSATVSVEEIEARVARPAGWRWLVPVAAVVGVAAVLLVVFGAGTGIGVPPSGPPAPSTSANLATSRDDAQLWPEWALPAPYDWEGVAAALRPRGNVVERPSEAQVRQATGRLDRLLDRVQQHLADSPRAAQAVGVHLALVTTDESARSRGLILDGEPMYVVETTGHQTGNCFDLWSATSTASSLDRPIFTACFYPQRSRPLPSVTELPLGTWASNSAFRDGSICLAIEVREPLAERHRAWWWRPGGSGDCESRSSSLVQAEATTDEVPLVKFQLPQIEDGPDALSLRLTGYTEGGFTLHTAPFHEVEEVDPVEWP